MDALISVLTFLVIIIVLILAHEIGHLVAAKSTGVTVEEFGLFYPPRLASFKWRGTLYSINAIPLGGFCKMAGEEDPDVSGSLASKNTAVKLLVLGAGSLMNFLLPILLFSIAYMIPHNEITDGSVKILEVSEDSPAAAVGILPGDMVISVDGKNVSSNNDVSRYIQMNETYILMQPHERRMIFLTQAGIDIHSMARRTQIVCQLADIHTHAPGIVGTQLADRARMNTKHRNS